MKATINGITVEGTPQEIMEFERLIKNEKPGTVIAYNPKTGITTDQIDKTGWDHRYFKTITTTGVHEGTSPTAGNCFAARNGGCYCTGECHTTRTLGRA